MVTRRQFDFLTGLQFGVRRDAVQAGPLHRPTSLRAAAILAMVSPLRALTVVKLAAGVSAESLPVRQPNRAGRNE